MLWRSDGVIFSFLLSTMMGALSYRYVTAKSAFLQRSRYSSITFHSQQRATHLPLFSRVSQPGSSSQWSKSKDSFTKKTDAFRSGAGFSVHSFHIPATRSSRKGNDISQKGGSLLALSQSSVSTEWNVQNKTVEEGSSTAQNSQEEGTFPLQIEFPIFYNDVYEVILPPNHRFPMEKYRQVRQRVQNQIPPSFIDDDMKKVVSTEFYVSPLSTVDELSTTHCPSYIERYLRGDLTPQEIRNTGFPWSPEHVNRSLSSVGGTVAAAKSVCDRLRRMQTTTTTGIIPNPPYENNNSDSKNYSDHNSQMNGYNTNELNLMTPNSQIPVWAAHVAGGTHHAFFDRGEGFCIFSDIAVAANVILRRYSDVVQRILIIDLDVHQGNGNAKLFQGRDDVFTFSMHCEDNLFSAKEESDLDIGLPSGCTDTTYLLTLKHWLKVLEDNKDKYDVIFYQAGVDIIKDDRLGKMNLTEEGVQRRNEMVFELATKTNKGLIITMGGGYPRKEWEPILDAHANVYIGAHDFLTNI